MNFLLKLIRSFEMTVPRTICAGFLMMITVGTGLLLLPFTTASGQWNDLVTALFTTTSAVCVTGLVVVDTGSYYSPIGQAIILLLIQMGGLGYMTATTVLILILRRRLGLKDRLAVQQSMDIQELSGAKVLVISILSMTLLFELTGMFLLIPVFSRDFGSGQGLWFAFFHSISAFNNAGFGLLSDNLVQYADSIWVNLVITGLVIFGGLGYQVIMEAFMWLRDRLQKRRIRNTFSLNFKLVTTTTIILLIGGTIALFFMEYNNAATVGEASFRNKLLAAWFQSVIARTAGFNTIDLNAMTQASTFVMISLMFIGASPGSTGGGIKTTTAGILFTCTRATLRGHDEVVAFGREIPTTRVLRAIGVVLGSGLVVVFVTTLLAVFNPNFSFLKLLFEVVSAFATVGVSTGITPDLSLISKLLIIATMYVGRVGVLLLMSAIVGDQSPTLVKHPEEDLLVG